MIVRLLRLLMLAGAIGGSAAQAADPEPQSLDTIRLVAGMHIIRAELADSPTERNTGLMHRATMPVNAGMLFVFEREGVHCFWMRNTRIALSIAFLDQEGRVVNLADMQPLDETSHCPVRPIRFALEMNQGWFSQRGIAPGMKLSADGLF